MLKQVHWLGLIGMGLAALPLHAAPALTPREALVEAAFTDRDKDVALAHIDRAQSGATAILARVPDDADAAVVQATAIGYHAKLTGDRSGAIVARKKFEALTLRYPRNPETWVALGAWHLGVIARLGRLAARVAAGAQKPVGLAALDKAVALGGNRAMFLGLAGLLRLELDPSDADGIRLTEAAVRGTTPTAIDRHLQRAATLVLAAIRTGDRKTTQALADRLLPLGQVP